MDRYLQEIMVEDALKRHKMAFVSGPRQVGKTFVGKTLLLSPENYFSWEQTRFRKKWFQDPLTAVADRGRGPILLDEIHKDRKWKSRLKGVYDTEGEKVEIIVTGSARLDLFRRGGDSLMGRYLPYRLHPISVGERLHPLPPEPVLQENAAQYSWQDLLRLSGFPEPFLTGEEQKAKRWSRLRLERLAAEDVRDLRAIHDLNAFRVLIDLLPDRVGSLLSINSLREDIGIAYATVRDWVMILEALYHCFLVRPYAGKLSRALKAEPKLYLYDILQIEDPAKRLENLAALHLLKGCHYWSDAACGDFDLRFIRNKEKEEVDFVILKDKKPWMLIECKSAEKEIAPALVRFSKHLRTPHNVQLVTVPNYHRFLPALGWHVMNYEKFFSAWI